MTQSCRRNVLSSLLTTHKVPFFQPPKHVLRNSSSQLFRSSLIRSYSNFAPKERKSVFFNIKKKFSAVQVMHGKLYNINWKEQIFVVRDLLLSCSLLFLIGDAIYVLWIDHSNEKHINETMEKGTRPQLAVLDDEYVPRHKDIERLKKIFHPSKNHAFYHVVMKNMGLAKQHY